MKKNGSKTPSKNVIGYGRVSTDDQAEHGYSLRDQRARVESYCQSHGLTLAAYFEDDASGGSFKRPGFQRALAMIETGAVTVAGLVFTRWDRLSRAPADEHYPMIAHIRRQGVELISVEEPADPNGDTGILLESIFHSLADLERRKIKRRTKDGMQRARIEGRWMGGPPRGYVASTDAQGKYLIAPGPEADIVREAFDLIASGAYSQAEVLRLLRPKGFDYGTTRFADMLRNPVYIAKQRRGDDACFAPDHDPDELIECVHEPLIDEDTFYRVQAILDGARGRRNRWKWSVPPELPLRGHLRCPDCGRDLTGSGSRSHTGAKHFYYHCQKQLGCGVRYRAADANGAFEALLSAIETPPSVLTLYEAVLDDVWRKRRGIQRDAEDRARAEVADIETKLKTLEERYYVDGDMNADTFERLSAGLKQRLAAARARESTTGAELSNRQQFIRDGLRLLSDITGYYRDASTATKQRIVRTLYPGKLTFDGEAYRTHEVHPALEIIELDINQLRAEQKESPEFSPGLERMVSPAGFEPASPT